jgi:glyoxylate reductase
VDDASADTALFLILAALRGFNNGIMAIRNRTWTGHVPPPPIGHDPQGKTLGILGMGGIGRNLKKKAEVLGMKVIYYNRTQLGKDLADGAEYVSFDELLARSDVLSLHVPLNVSRDLFLRYSRLADCNYTTEQNSKLDLYQGI